MPFAELLPFVNQVCVLLLIGLLTAAAVWDATTFTIPNWISLVLVVLFIPYAATLADPAWSAIGWRLLAATIIFGVGFALFAVNAMGGGDVKLMTAVALYTTTEGVAEFLVIMALFGGLLCLGAFVLHSVKRTMGLSTPPLKNIKIPYGLAICAGGYSIAMAQLNLAMFFPNGVL